MINIYNWSYEIDKNLVRIEFLGNFKTKLLSAVSKFNGILLPVDTQPNEFIAKFKNEKSINDFINYTTELLPNKFHLVNNWDLANHSEKILSFTVLRECPKSLTDVADVLNSFMQDCTTISALTKNKISDLQINLDSSICYITFNIKFADDEKATEFMKDFFNFKA